MKKIWEQKQHLIVAVLILAMSFALFLPAAVTVQADSDDVEFLMAQPISMGQTVMGVIDETGDVSENGTVQCYSFYLPSAGSVDIDITAYFEKYGMFLYDQDGETLYSSTDNNWTKSLGYVKDYYYLYLEQGNYYIKITSSNYSYRNSYTGTYDFSIDFESTDTTNRESDNSFAEANTISLGQSAKGQISINDDCDIYCFTMAASGCVEFDITSYMKYYCIILFDADGKQLWYADCNERNKNVGYRQDTYQIDLEQGSYYIQVNGYYSGSRNKSTGYYELSTGFESSNAMNQESDNSLETANRINLSTTYKGQIALNDDLDTYCIQISQSGTYRLAVTSYMKYYCVDIYRQNGERLWHTDCNEWNVNVGYRKDSHDITLTAGTYYIQINGYYSGNRNKSTGNYNFSLKKIGLKSIKLTEKSITVYKGYTHQLYYTLNPTSISTTLKWKSSNKRIASVDKNGLVTGKRKGVARITVTTKEGKKASCKVKVLNY